MTAVMIGLAGDSFLALRCGQGSLGFGRAEV